MDDNTSPQDQTSEVSSSPDESGYALTVDQAAELFAAEGTPRSPRTVRRYCNRGVLDCVLADTQNAEMWLITENSVRRRVTELKQLIANAERSGRARMQPDATGNDQSSPDGSGPGQERPQHSTVTAERIDELEREVLDLKITNRGKDFFIERLKEERDGLLRSIAEQGRLIGQLQERLQISAPSEFAEPPVEPVSNPQEDLGPEALR